MIGLPVGLAPVGADLYPFNPIIPQTPNIFLNGTLDFGYTFPQPNLSCNLLNFPLITNDDNFIQVNLLNSLNAQLISPTAVAINIYAPNTTTPAILSPAAILITGGFQFSLPNSEVFALSSGEYSWVARVTLLDGTKHTVTCGDQNQTTGTITVLERP